LTLTGSTTAGGIIVGDPYDGDITVNGIWFGTMSFVSDLSGTVTIGSTLGGGTINIFGDLAHPGRVIVAGSATGSSTPLLHIRGSVTGSGASVAPIQVGNVLGRVIAIEGSLENVSSGDEILVVTSMQSSAAIVIDYDGWDDGDDWVSGATVQVGASEYSGNSPSARVYEISDCKGDMNNDTFVDTDDEDPFDDALNDPGQYASDFPGLDGSAEWHGDCNLRDGFTSDDQEEFDNLVGSECCLNECLGDVDGDLDADLTDLSILLGAFGTTSGATIDDGDLDGDEDVDLTDLSLLLSNYGTVCHECPTPATGTADVSLSVSAYDTSGYTGGGFKGEEDDFVFDVLVEVNDEDDDWTAAGVCATAYNDAAFLLVDDPGDPPVPGSTEPEKYASFFSVPKGVNNGSRFTNPFPTGGIAGGCHPLSPSYAYTTTSIHAAWLDWDTDSNDGPAAIVRLTIDVSGVTGADVSGGLGSVYFSTTGPATGGDIKVAGLALDCATKYGGATFETLSGEFFVTD